MSDAVSDSDSDSESEHNTHDIRVIKGIRLCYFKFSSSNSHLELDREKNYVDSTSTDHDIPEEQMNINKMCAVVT